MSIFFLLSFKKCNKLDEYIYIYFFIIPIIPSIIFSITKIIVGFIKKKNLDYIFFVTLLVSLK